MKNIKVLTLLAIQLFCLFSALAQSNASSFTPVHKFNKAYRGRYVEHIAFPIGGMGAGMFCLEGTGAISHMSIRNNPELFNEPLMFAAISIKDRPGSARVLEGPVPDWKKFGQRGSGGGAGGAT